MFREQEIRHSEHIAQLSEQNKVLIAANAAGEEENARLRHETETRSAENAGLRQEIVALNVENAAHREERSAIELLDKAVEQYRAGRKTAQAAMRARKPEITADAADLPSAGADRAAERLDSPDGERDAAQPAISPSESADAEPIVLFETEAVFRLPSVLLARVDEAIETTRRVRARGIRRGNRKARLGLRPAWQGHAPCRGQEARRERGAERACFRLRSVQVA